MRRDVLYVEGLKYNMLRISQLCDKGLTLFWNLHICPFCNNKDNKVLLLCIERKTFIMRTSMTLQNKILNALHLLKNQVGYGIFY